MSTKTTDINAMSDQNQTTSNKSYASRVTEDSTHTKMVSLKRQVTVRSIVTEGFRQRAKAELSDELRLIESQQEQLENQYQASMKQIENLARTGQNVTMHLEQLNQDVQEKRNQLTSVKLQVSSNLANLDRVQNGELVVTGVLENYVDIQLGDNIYDRIRGAEIIVEDGIVKDIIS